MIEDTVIENKRQLEQACTYIMRSQRPDVEKVLIIILLRNGLRISEICNPSLIKVISPFQVIIYATKNNTWRSCTTGEASNLLREDRVLKDLKIWKRNRQYYYRALKGVLPHVESSRTKNNPVTHAARNIQAQQVYEATNSIEATKVSIGNRSSSATERYITGNQRKALQKQGIKGSISGSVDNIVSSVKNIIRIRK